MSGKWHSGPPPSCGWWIASVCRDESRLRWWDGSRWSFNAKASDTKKRAARMAKIPLNEFASVEWQDRPKSWPERSKT